MTDVMDERNAQEYALPDTVACWLKISPPFVVAKAQIMIATHAAGTMIDFAMNRSRNWLGCMQRKGI